MKIRGFALLLVVTGSLSVQASAQKPVPVVGTKGVVASFDAIPTRQGPAQKKAALAWLKKHGKQSLGGSSYLKELALFLAGKRPLALKGIASRFSKSKLPAKNHAELATTVLIEALDEAVAAKDLTLVKSLIETALLVGPDTALVYRDAGQLLHLMTTKEAKRAFTRLAARLLRDERVPRKRRFPLMSEMTKLRERPQKLIFLLKLPQDTDAKGRKVPILAADGKPISLKEYEGKILLVDFWATWCGPCMREMPSVVNLLDKHRKDGFDVLGISLDTAKTKGRMPRVMKNAGMTWRQICDGLGWDSPFAKANNVNAIPMTFLLDRSGKIRFVGLRGKKLEARVKELIAEDA